MERKGARRLGFMVARARVRRELGSRAQLMRCCQSVPTRPKLDVLRVTIGSLLHLMRSPLALSPTTGERIKKRGLLNGFLLVKVTSNCQLKVPDPRSWTFILPWSKGRFKLVGRHGGIDNAFLQDCGDATEPQHGKPA